MRSCLIYFTADSVRLAAAAEDRKHGLQIREFETAISGLDDTESLPRFLETLAKENKIYPERVTVGLPRNRVSMRHLRFPSHSDGEIRRMVSYELTNLFPCKPEELLYDYSVIQKEAGGNSQVLLTVARKEDILSHVNLLRRAGLTVDAIEISSISLYNQLIEQKKASQDCLFIHLDNGYLDILQVSGQKLIFSRGMRFSKEDSLEDVLKAITTTFAVREDRENHIQKVILTGTEFSAGTELIRRLESALPCPVEIDQTITLSKGFLQRKSFHSLRIGLLPAEYMAQKEKQAGKRSLRLFIVLAAVNALLVGNIIFLKLKISRQYLMELKSEITTLDAQTSAAQNTVLKIQLLRRYRSESKMSLGIFSQLYRAIPENIRVTQLEILRGKQTNSIIISGQAPDSETVLQFAGNLKTSPVIQNTAISHITKKGPAAGNRVNFEIKAGF